MADKEVLLETTQNGNDEQLAITRPVDYIEQYRNAHKDLVMTGDDMARNYTYDPATWTPSQPKESRGRAIAMGLTDFATDIVETPQQVSQWATGGIVGLKKTFFPNMDETEFERTYRNVQRKMNKAAEARAEEIAKTGYPETYEWTNAISNLALLYIPTGFIGANIGAIGATSAAAAKSIAKGLGVTARQAKNIAKGAKKGAEVAVGTLAGVQTTGQLSQEFAQQYASDTGDAELKNYNPSKDASLSALLGVVSGFVNSKLDVSRYAGRFNSEKSITKALEQGLRGATEEFAEESIESITQDIGRIASGYQYDLSLDDVLTNALTNGIMGAVLGGVAGAGLYSINRARMVKWYTDKGLTEDTAKKVTDQMLTEGRSQILDQINTNYELATKNGEAYTKVKDIYQKLLENVGSKNSVELADTYARMTADWLTMHADQYGLPTSLFIDANEAMDNMVALRQFTSQDVKDRITELKTTLVHQKNIGEASNPDIVADAKRKLRVLQKVDTINTNKENARMKALDLKIAKTQGLYDKIESAWNKPSAMGTTEEKLAYLSNGNKNTFKKTMVYAPAKVKNGLAQVADKVNEPIRASIANALGKLDSVNKENFIDSVSNSISNTDLTLDNTMLYMMLFEDQATLSNFTSLYADKTEKDVNLSSKDAIGQSLKEIDELKQIANPNYQSKFGSNGEMLDPNMLAAFMSYQNQYQTLNQTTYTEETININGVEKTVYNSKGERIANTELELRSFYNWFGDSKAVDKQGRPLVVYHGARGKSDITEFIPQEYGYNVEATYFATNKSAAGHWAETSYTKRNINPDEYMKRVYETDSVKELLDMYNSFGAKTEIVEYDGFYRLNEHDGMLSSPLGKKITESTFEVNGRTIDLVKELQRKISSIVYDSVNSDLYSVYAKLDNPLVVDAKKNPYWKIEYDGTTTNTETIATKAKAQGYDGVIIKNVLETDYENVLTDDVMVFDSAQIKSTDNRGTYDSRTPNIYYQTDTLYQLQTSESNKDVAYTNKSVDVINMLGNLRNPVRFMFDETNKQWIIGKGDSLVHDSMWRQAYKDGMLDFKSESDAIDYFNLSRYEDKNIHSFVALPYSNNDFMTPMHEFGDDYQYMYVVPTNNTDGFIVLSRQPNGKDLLNSGLDKVYNSGTLYNISSEYKPELVKESTSQYTWDSEAPALFQRNAIGGWYDPELATIALGRNFNELTLAHELAHHWLTQYFNLYKQYKEGTFKAPDGWARDAEKLFSIIGIEQDQAEVTREQQEKWATMNEAYLTGFVPEELKNNISYRDFQRWIPEKYKSILQIGYLDQDNNVINPILSESDIEFFNKWYAHPDFTSLHVQPEAQKWAEKATSTKVMNDREKTIAQDWEEQESGIKTMDRIRNDNIPTDLKAAVDAEEVRIHNKDSQEIPNLPEHKSFSLFGAKNAQERMADIARNYVQKNIEHAKEIAMANPLFVENDTGVDREFLILAVIEHENYQMGSPEYAQLMHNAARTRQIAGSTLGLHNTNSFKWYIDAINQIEETLENKAAINYAGKKRNAVNIYNADIERFVLNKVDSILATAKESKERDVALAAMFAEAKTKFSGNVSGTALTQLDLTGKKATRANKQAFIEWAKREIKRRAGVDITSEMQVELLQVSQKAQQAETELDSQDEAKAIAAAKTIREWQNKVNSYKKTDKGKVGRFFDSVFGEYAPRAMLFSPSTLLANIPGNVINGLITSSVNKVYGKNKVSQEAQKAEIHRLKQISRATGMNFATMEKPTSPSILHGEKYKQTTGAIKAIDPFTYLSETDNLFRIPIFVDTLARIATKHAEEQGVSPTELFRQYCKLHNEKGSVAQQARLEAIEIGNIAVFTQNGMLAKMANKIRDALNVVGTGNVGLGNLISPFVKTPANIVEMGARAIAFPVTGWKTLLNWNNATDKAKFDFALDGATLALSVLATVLMSALQDDREWYAEPYESGKYDSNKPYDSIRFGNAWIRLDQFGTLMLPMQVGAKLVKDLQDGKAGAEIAESTGWQVFSELLRQTPVIDTFQENSMKWAATHPGQYALNYAYNQANKLVPAWGKQIARPTLRESGIVLTPESKIGKRAVRNYGLDGQDNTINDWLGIIYGRLKVEQ